VNVWLSCFNFFVRDRHG